MQVIELYSKMRMMEARQEMKKYKVLLLIMLILDSMLISAGCTLCIIGANYDLNNLSKIGNTMMLICVGVLIAITCLQYYVLKKDKKPKQKNNNEISHE